MKSRYSITYFISQAIKGLWRNKMSYGSALVLSCCLIVLGSFGLLVYNLNINLDEFKLANEIVVYLDYDATDEDVSRVDAKIEALKQKGVGEITFISKEQALESMREQYSDYDELFDSIDAEENPLAHSYVLKVTDVSRGMEIQFDLENLDDSVRKVNNRMDIAQQFEKTKSSVVAAFSLFFLGLFCVCVIVIVNTINFAVYARRNEISIMRYVGATGFFIATPFVLEGIIIGLVSGLSAYFSIRYIYSYLVDMIGEDITLINVVPFDSVGTYLLLGVLGIGFVTGIIGSLISLRKRVEA